MSLSKFIKTKCCYKQMRTKNYVMSQGKKNDMHHVLRFCLVIMLQRPSRSFLALLWLTGHTSDQNIYP